MNSTSSSSIHNALLCLQLPHLSLNFVKHCLNFKNIFQIRKLLTSNFFEIPFLHSIVRKVNDINTTLNGKGFLVDSALHVMAVGPPDSGGLLKTFTMIERAATTGTPLGMSLF